jgi:hypothetical protein
VGVDVISCCAGTIVDLPGFVVLAAAEYGGELELLVETTTRLLHGEQCGTRAQVHGALQCLVQVGSLGGEDLDALVQVAVAGGERVHPRLGRRAGRLAG